MPYINHEVDIEATCYEWNGVGVLNCAISLVLSNYIKAQGLSYSTINDIVGALDCAKMEFYRKVAVPYEERKEADSVYTYHPEKGLILKESEDGTQDDEDEGTGC